MIFTHFDDSTLARARSGRWDHWYPAHGDQCSSHQSYFSAPTVYNVRDDRRFSPIR